MADDHPRTDVREAIAVLRQRGQSLCTFPPHITASKAVVLVAVARDGLSIRHAAPRLRDDPLVAWTAVNQCATSLKYTGSRARSDPFIVHTAVSHWPSALKYASKPLQERLDIVTAAARRDGFMLNILGQIGSPLAQHRLVAIAAVSHAGLALKYASPMLRTDPEVVLEAVSSNGHALQFASPELRDCANVVQVAVYNAPAAFLMASPRLRSTDLDCAVLALSRTGTFSSSPVDSFGHLNMNLFDVRNRVNAQISEWESLRLCMRVATRSRSAGTRHSNVLRMLDLGRPHGPLHSIQEYVGRPPRLVFRKCVYHMFDAYIHVAHTLRHVTSATRPTISAACRRQAAMSPKVSP